VDLHTSPTEADAQSANTRRKLHYKACWFGLKPKPVNFFGLAKTAGTREGTGWDVTQIIRRVEPIPGPQPDFPMPQLHIRGVSTDPDRH
jgi:hypothetical protein